MTRSRSAVFFFSMLFAGLAIAQSDGTSSEFGRGSGGEISLITKSAGRLSGSFGISSRSGLPFGSGKSGYDATLGGTIVEDRIWFFASAQRSDSVFGTAVPQDSRSKEAVSRAIDAKLAMQLGSRQNLAATFASQRGVAPAFANAASTPSSFLSLRYTGIVSDQMFFTTSYSRSSGVPSTLGLDPR